MSDNTDAAREQGVALDTGAPDISDATESSAAPENVDGRPGTTGAPAPPDKASEQQRDAAAQEDDAPAERRERRYLDRIDEEERDWLRRQENLRELDGDDTSVRAGRDATGRDQVSGGSSVFNIGNIGSLWLSSTSDDGQRVQVRYLEHSAAVRLNRCMVVPPSQADLHSVLDGQSVLFLRGAEGSGRMTAALHALLAWTQADIGAVGDAESTHVGVIIVRSPSHRGAPDLRERHGYVLEPPGTGGVWDLGTLAETMKDAVGKKGSRLIIIVPPGASSLPDLVIDHKPPPAPEVFKRWLEYEALNAKVDLELLDELRQEIEDELRQETSPRQAVHLARRLAGWLKAGRKPDEIRAELPRRLREDIRRRLDGDKPVLGRCFMTSAAVLNGLQETTVSNAALNLVEHIKKVSSIKPDELLPAWEQLGTWLDYAAASISPAEMSGGGRTVWINPRAESLTLQVLWEDHPTIREPLAAWLRSLAEGASQAEVQMKAAHAAGVLATLNFEIAKQKFIEPWAKARILNYHRLAAMMLESAVTHDPEIMPIVLDLLGKLTRGTHYERLAAARAYGSSIGPRIFRIALRELRRIALAFNVEICKTVAGSICNLYSDRTAEVIIGELASWAGIKSLPSDRYISALAFVRLARIVSGKPAYPPLTDLKPGDATTGRLSVLWRNALDFRIVTRRAQHPELAVPDSWDVLVGWVRRYDEDQVIRAVIDAVLRPRESSEGTADTARLRRALSLNLWKWQHENVISRDLREQLTRLMRGD